MQHSADLMNARYPQCSVAPWSELRASGGREPCVTCDAIIRCSPRPDDDAASPVAPGARMMQQAQLKTAATWADATPSVRRPCLLSRLGTFALYQFGRRPPAAGRAGSRHPGRPARHLRRRRQPRRSRRRARFGTAHPHPENCMFSRAQAVSLARTPTLRSRIIFRHIL
jgi:hypothetical protein